MVQGILSGVFLWGALALLGTPTQAGLNHTRDAGACQDCHKPGSGGSDPSVLIACLITATPRQSAFGQMDINQTCLECHSGRGGSSDGPSVMSGWNATVVRQAGFLLGPGGFVHVGHTLGSTEPAPGGTWSATPRGSVSDTTES